jgi:hypothetical protein
MSFAGIGTSAALGWMRIGGTSKVPFTVVEQLNAQIGTPCGIATLFAGDFIASNGGYSSYKVSKSPSGPWTVSLDFVCAEGGVGTVYVQGDGTLVVSASIFIQDNFGFCDGCP